MGKKKGGAKQKPIAMSAAEIASLTGTGPALQQHQKVTSLQGVLDPQASAVNALQEFKANAIDEKSDQIEKKPAEKPIKVEEKKVEQEEIKSVFSNQTKIFAEK